MIINFIQIEKFNAIKKGYEDIDKLFNSASFNNKIKLIDEHQKRYDDYYYFAATVVYS